MSNPIYETMNRNQYDEWMRQFNQFKDNFNGDPRQQIQQMLNSGKITQAQYDQAVQKANLAIQKSNMLQKMLGMM